MSEADKGNFIRLIICPRKCVLLTCLLDVDLGSLWGFEERNGCLEKAGL